MPAGATFHCVSVGISRRRNVAGGRGGGEAKYPRRIILKKGLCHQIKITWKWYCCKGLGMDMRHLIFKIFLSEPSIFNRHLKFLCLGSKRVQIFILFRT